MSLTWQIVLAVLTLLFGVNRRLDGLKTLQVTEILGCGLLLLVGYAFFAFGWKAGLFEIGPIFLYAFVFELILPRRPA
jgi:hypothetical protein